MAVTSVLDSITFGGFKIKIGCWPLIGSGVLLKQHCSITLVTCTTGQVCNSLNTAVSICHLLHNRASSRTALWITLLFNLFNHLEDRKFTCAIFWTWLLTIVNCYISINISTLVTSHRGCSKWTKWAYLTGWTRRQNAHGTLRGWLVNLSWTGT